MTNLVNLLTLDINGCENLKALPDDLRKLINLRCLNTDGCRELKHMPAGMGEMTSLQYLSVFKIGKATSEKEGVKRSGLDVLTRLRNQLRGELVIEFECGMEEDWDRDECSWHLPVSPERLRILYYPGLRIPHWSIDGTANNLASLTLKDSREVKYLPPLRRLPNLKYLSLLGLKELEYVEEEEEEEMQHQLPSMATTTTVGGFVHNNANSSICFPSLEVLRLGSLPGLKGWWRKVASAYSTAPLQFPRLSELSIVFCPMLELKSLPLCPHLRLLYLYAVGDNEMTQQQLPSTICCSTSPPGIEEISIFRCHWLSSLQVSEALSSLRFLVIYKCRSLKSLHLASPHLQTIEISNCKELVHFELLVEAPATSLRVLKFEMCKKLKNFHIAAQLNALEELTIAKCPELELWESQDNTSVDWDSLSNLRKLKLVELPDCPERLPYCLRHRQALGKLKISEALSSLRFLVIKKCHSLKSLHLALPHPQTIEVSDCNELAHFELLVEAPATSLRVLIVASCKKLKKFHIAAQLNALEKLTIVACPELELWESQDNMSVDWDSLSNLRKLNLSKLPDCPERLPYCLRHRQAIGKLKISHRSSSWRIKYRSDDILAGWSDYII